MNGILAKKLGMTQLFNEAGNVEPVSVLLAGPCQVSQVKAKAKDGYDAVQLTFGKHKREFRVTSPGEYQVGQEIKVKSFKPGEMVAVTGRTIGKGFAGVTKRYHHHRGPMSHGSKSHRIPGAIGSGTTPGRVYKGRRMPGRLGGSQATIKRTMVIQVDAAKNLLLLRGGVPGKSGNLLIIKKLTVKK